MTRELLPAGRRELSRAHITFYRAAMDGVELSKAWELYLQLEGDYTDTLAKATMHWVRQALIQEGEALLEYPLQRSDGAIRHVRDEARAVTDPAGALIGVVGQVLDITDQRAADAALVVDDALRDGDHRGRHDLVDDGLQHGHPAGRLAGHPRVSL